MGSACTRASIWLIVGLSIGGCAEDAPRRAAECDEACRHATAVRGLRETMKLVYNLTLQGNAVGTQDARVGCPLGGEAHVFGEATSNARHGATEVSLTYQFDGCRYLQRDEEPEENYDLVIDGTVSQVGTLAAQPSATTALVIASDSLTIQGSVYDPALPYALTNCTVRLGQNGSLLSGIFCEHAVGVDL